MSGAHSVMTAFHTLCAFLKKHQVGELRCRTACHLAGGGATFYIPPVRAAVCLPNLDGCAVLTQDGKCEFDCREHYTGKLGEEKTLMI